MWRYRLKRVPAPDKNYGISVACRLEMAQENGKLLAGEKKKASASRRASRC